MNAPQALQAHQADQANQAPPPPPGPLPPGSVGLNAPLTPCSLFRQRRTEQHVQPCFKTEVAIIAFIRYL